LAGLGLPRTQNGARNDRERSGNDIRGCRNDPSEARLHGASIIMNGNTKEKCLP